MPWLQVGDSNADVLELHSLGFQSSDGDNCRVETPSLSCGEETEALLISFSI